eukprot:NODE_3637_length_1315_cov_36.601510_g3182_i0.p1 GENE.NODE_3637_length_1315_cov_36.601510_g3182_i0~~NODE_3637_length_1315_cov_36.601510_g3182_i0.p1  ORF type:complete len:410 (+),score=64.31 NODE_3637_length_1315_cov_36.601510_g3182_i0:37-1230(+)
MIAILLGFIVSALALEQPGIPGVPPDPGQGTVKGCICTSQCGATVDFGNSKYDWCYTSNNCGEYSVSRLSYYDYCIYPSNSSYESLPAQVKQSIVWEQVIADQTGGSYPSTLELAGIFTESVKTTFDDDWDFMPAGRRKYIHSVGSVGLVKFIPTPDTPYTGVFSSGASYGLIRMSSAQLPTENPPLITPGFGIKFFRSGVRSANFMAMPSLDGQTDFNFFAKNFTNHPAFPTGFALQLVARKFWQASSCPLRVGLSDTAKWDQFGNPSTSVAFPWVIVFVPTGQVQFPSDYYNETTLGQLFRDIKNGTRLFDVYAYDSPQDELNKVTPRKIGSLFTTSEFVKSTYGDNTLAFKHIYSEFDFRLKPDWLEVVNKDAKSICGMDSVGPDPPAGPSTKS